MWEVLACWAGQPGAAPRPSLSLQLEPGTMKMCLSSAGKLAKPLYACCTASVTCCEAEAKGFY